MNVHVYSTKNAIDDQVIILKKLKQNHEKRKSVVIERLCFKNSIKKITQYLSDEKIEVEGKLVAYHAAGNFLSGVKSYMTESTPKYNTVGGGNVLIDGFVGTFGDAFDATVIEDGEKISAGQLSIVDIDMVVNSDNDAYKVEIPKIKAVYTHMLGQDCHSIIIGAGHANATIANLQSYLDKSYKIFLSTHYGPETRQDVKTKIAYHQDLKAIVVESSSAEDFTAMVNAKYHKCSGANYLSMTAWFFFPM